jgi:Flp pilus assembly protein TadG
MARSGRRLLASFALNRRGMAAVEFSLIAVPFFAILLERFEKLVAFA